MKKNKPNANKIKKIKVPLIDRVTDGLDLPKETFYDMPYITLLGNKEIQIENFISILAYTEEHIRLKTQCGTLMIEGKKLEAKHMNSESMCIRGAITGIAFTR
ncbi:MAG: YabP/YqfC family sporulation protein [Cellulosilyticaceae bacterium]